ncbi:protein neprosin [Ziziphus jujuba]|uniref:Protein neprosin n=1 Tax=Ziziphus jujuba TaxID=326968 RepID=A0A6P6GA32_ZIZJJ|nr:protein neprosin [Ziziphus jujuba]
MGKRLIFCDFRFRRMVILLGILSPILFWFSEAKFLSKQRIIQVGRKTNHLRRHILKSIQSEDGDIVDCIDIYKQPAFDHPVLKNHTIQMKPTYNPTDIVKERSKESAMTVTQIWKRSGSCPKGTIPVRRTQKRHLLKTSTPIEDYGRKKQRYSYPVGKLNESKNLQVQLANHSKAILLTLGYRYTGAKGDIRVYNPFVESDDEYSTSQICLVNGPYYDFESVESGWAVNPSVYGDRQTRLFVYWTADASKTTGCFDLTCPGFVQTSDEIALGAAIYPISVPNGLPYQITIYIFKDPITSNWWMQYGENVNIGYWPAELFKAIRYNAASVEWGGEVYSKNVGREPHTATDMGSGQYPDYVFGSSGVIKRMRIRDNSPTLKFPEWVETFTDEFNCYDVQYIGDYVEDPEFYYGGPGRSDRCP